jgi:aerobic-type carbon monoxide dehydrogenase small subunit (CoxS/CutS family)
MAAADNLLTFGLNGKIVSTSAEVQCPLLYVLTDELKLQGPRYGCGLGQCGSCSVLVDGVEKRACLTPVGAISGHEVTTLEGLADFWNSQQSETSNSELSPIQAAVAEVQGLQCGYCYNGIMIKATELLLSSPKPSEAQIKQALNGHLCRCGTYPKIIAAVQLASEKIATARPLETTLTSLGGNHE